MANTDSQNTDRPAAGLLEWAGALDIALSPKAAELIILHARMVREANARVRLTGTRELDGIIRKHSLDSLAAAPLIRKKNARTLLDVGSGAGFPGMPLHAACPALETTLIDSSLKKCSFMEEAASELGIQNISVINERAEDFCKNTSCRENYDVVVCRAVAHLGIIAEYSLPFLRVGGVFIAYKGPGAIREIEEAGAALAELGGEAAVSKGYTLPAGGEKRVLVLVRKIRETPGRYPRRQGAAQKRPIAALMRGAPGDVPRGTLQENNTDAEPQS